MTVEEARAYIAEVDKLHARVDRGEIDGDLVEWTSIADIFLDALEVLRADRDAS